MVISQTTRPTGYGTYDELTTGSGTPTWQLVSDQSLSTMVDPGYANVYKKSTYTMANPTRTGIIINVKACAEAGHGNGTGLAYGKTAIYSSGKSLVYGDEYYFGSSGSTYYDLVTEYAVNPWTSSPWTWDDVDALQVGAALKQGSGGYSVCREVFMVVESVLPSGSRVQVIGMMY